MRWLSGVAIFDPDAMARARAARGLTFDRLAEQLGRRRANLIVYKQGAVAPTPAMLVRLAEALGVEPCELTTVSPEAAELADLRVWAGKTIAEAAADAEMPTSTWEKTERAQRPLGHERATRMAQALGVDEITVRTAYERTAANRGGASLT